MIGFILGVILGVCIMSCVRISSNTDETEFWIGQYRMICRRYDTLNKLYAELCNDYKALSNGGDSNAGE